MGGVSRSFQTLKGNSGAKQGDVRLFDRDPGSGWVSEDGSVPFSEQRRAFLLASTMGSFQTLPPPFSAGALDGMSKIGSRVYAWQGSLVAYTDDGETWTTLTNSMAPKTSAGFGGVLVFNGLLILTSYQYGDAFGQIETSSNNGQTFTTRLRVQNGAMRGLFEVDGALYALNNVGVWRSPDGITWTQVMSALAMDLTVTSKYIIVSSSGGLYRSLRAAPNSGIAGWSFFYSPNSETWAAVVAGEDDSVYAAYRDVVVKGPADGGESTKFGEVSRGMPGNAQIASIAFVDGLFAIGTTRLSGGATAVVQTTRDFATFDTLPAMADANAQGVRRIYVLGRRVLLGGGLNQRGAVLTQRGLPMLRKPPGKSSWKAYTRL